MQSIEAVFRAEHGKILATLIRALGDWQLAEDALMDAMTTALERWPSDGMPDNPGAWLTAAARRKGIDHLRRRQTRTTHAGAVKDHLEIVIGERRDAENRMQDDRLSLIFTCCHPALAPEARVALTLRYVGGLSTKEVARAFLIAEPTMAKRLVRAKHKISGAGIPYRVPEGDELPPRIGAVCRVVYLIFNEGYSATAGDELVRRELCEEAIRLTRMLQVLLPDEPEVTALLALMLLTHSRRAARVDGDGELVLLADQDRGRWDRDAIDQGHAQLQIALGHGRPGPYVLQACIADLHANAPDDGPDWPQIAALYQALFGLTRNPVVRLNHAVAVAMAKGPETGLGMLDDALAGQLAGYHLFHAARADLLRRIGRWSEASVAYRRALELVSNAPEQRYLRRRLDEVAAMEA